MSKSIQKSSICRFHVLVDYGSSQWSRCSLARHSPLGSSACLASLRRAAANPELADWATAFPLVNGLSGLTVAVVRVAVEIIPNEGDLDPWFIPEREDQNAERGSHYFQRSGSEILFKLLRALALI